MAYIGNQPSSVTSVNSSSIEDGSIQNVDIAADAAIEVSKLDGVTATNTELNKLDGATVTTSDLNVLAGADAAGVTGTELQHLNGVTSNIQTQLTAASGGATKGTLTKSFVTGETSTIALSSASTPTASVFVTKEISQDGVTNGDWNVNANDTGYDIEDFAYSEDVTINTTDRIATLASSSWAADDVGKRIVGGGGVATLLNTTGDIEISTPFDTSNPTLTSGSWNFYGVVFSASGVSLNRADGLSTVSADISDNFMTNTDQIFNYDNSMISTTDRKVRMSPDGTLLFMLDVSGRIHSVTLDTPYDISSTPSGVTSFNPGQTGTMNDFIFSPDGTKLVVLSTVETLFYYTLSSPYNLSSPSYVSTFDLSTILTDAVSIAFNATGTSMYVLDNNDNRIYQYSLSTGWDVSTSTYAAKSGYVGSTDTTASPERSWENVYFIEVNPTTSKLYLSTSGNVLDPAYAFVHTLKFNVLGDIGTLEFEDTISHPYASASLGDFSIIEDGYGVLFTNGSSAMFKYTMSQPYVLSSNSNIGGDVSSQILVASTNRLTFAAGHSPYLTALSPNGEMLLVITYNTTADDIYSYLFTLAVPYDISSDWTYRTLRAHTLSNATAPVSVCWAHDNSSYVVAWTGTETFSQASVNPSTYAQTLTATITGTVITYPSGPIAFSYDGSKFYAFPGYNYGGYIYQYNLGSPFDISGINLNSPDSNVLVSDIPNLVQSLDDSTQPNSRKYYGVGMSTVSDTEVYVTVGQIGTAKLTLTTPNDITTATVAKFTDAGGRPLGYNTKFSGSFRFTPDGKSVIGGAGGVYKSTLPSAYNIFANEPDNRALPNKTAEASTVNADETKAYQFESTTGVITEVTLGTLPFPQVGAVNTSSTFTATTHESAPTDILFNADGTKLFVVGNGTDSIYSYSVPTAFDISTATTTGYTSYPFTEDTDVQSTFFNDDGTKMYMVGNANKTLYQYSLATAYDLSNVTYDTVSLDVEVFPETLADIYAATFGPDGKKLFVTGLLSNSFYIIAQFDLPTAYVLTGATLNNYATTAQSKSLTFNSDYTRYYGNGYIHSAERNITNASVTPTSQNLAAVTNSVNTIDTEYWTDINSMAALSTESNSGNVYFALSLDAQVTFKVADNSNGKRSIVRNNGGTWEYNSNTTYGSETWVAASTNSKFKAFDEAIDIAANQMDATQLATVSDFNHFVLGDTLDLAIILNQSGIGTPAISDGVSINYDAAALNKGAILGTDYDYDVPTSTSVRITSLKDHNLKVKVV